MAHSEVSKFLNTLEIQLLTILECKSRLAKSLLKIRNMQNAWTPSHVTAICAVTGLITTLFGLGFAMKQIRSAAVDRLFARMHNFHQLFLDKPELREFFYGGRHFKHDIDDVRVLVTAEALTDFFQQIYYELPNMPKRARGGWRNYIRDLTKRSSVLQSHIIQNSDWYHPNFVDWLVGTSK